MGVFTERLQRRGPLLSSLLKRIVVNNKHETYDMNPDLTFRPA